MFYYSSVLFALSFLLPTLHFYFERTASHLARLSDTRMSCFSNSYAQTARVQSKGALSIILAARDGPLYPRLCQWIKSQDGTNAFSCARFGAVKIGNRVIDEAEAGSVGKSGVYTHAVV